MDPWQELVERLAMTDGELIAYGILAIFVILVFAVGVPIFGYLWGKAADDYIRHGGDEWL